MPEMDDHSPLPDDVASQELAAKLKAVLESLPHPIPVYLFTQKGKNDVFNGAAKQVIQSFQELTDKIHLNEYDLKHKLATKWKIDSSPTILFDPKHYNIRWKGAPAGQEAQTFLQAIILIGSRKSNLSEHSITIMKRIDTPRHIKLFVSISCPYCPQQAVNAIKAAIESPELITLEIIDILANPEIAVKYSAQSVPQTYINDVLIIQGAQPEELFILSLEKLEK